MAVAGSVAGSLVGAEAVRAGRPLEVSLTLEPSARYDAIDVTEAIRQACGDVLSRYRRALYCSYHTTAGYLEQALQSRLRDRHRQLDPFIRTFQRLFPAGADYRHDRLDERRELSAEQRRNEPKNADSHLAFIGSGLKNCTTYVTRPGEAVYFMDLDGVNGTVPRSRRTTVLAYDREERIAEERFAAPVSRHAIDSVNLGDPRIGLFALVEDLASRHGVERGRVDISLTPSERDAGVTVNEYETLLMRHDLAEVLRDPLKFAMRTGRRALTHPRAIPAKSLGYAKYDAVRVINELMDALHLTESAVARLVARLMAMPAERFLRLKRSVSFFVSDDGSGRASVVQGTYQTPILIQWAAADGHRDLQVSLSRLT